MRRLLATATITVAMGVAVPLIPAGATPGVGSCPTHYTYDTNAHTAKHLQETLGGDWTEFVAGIDKNGDKYVCWKDNGQSGSNVIDDKRQKS